MNAKNAKLIILALAVVTVLGLYGYLNAQEEATQEDRLKVTTVFPKDEQQGEGLQLIADAEYEYVLGEPINMTLKLKNTESKPLTIFWPSGINGINRNPQGWLLKIHIYTPSHKTKIVEPAVLYSLTYFPKKSDFVVLQPGESISVDVYFDSLKHRNYSSGKWNLMPYTGREEIEIRPSSYEVKDDILNEVFSEVGEYTLKFRFGSIVDWYPLLDDKGDIKGQEKLDVWKGSISSDEFKIKIVNMKDLPVVNIAEEAELHNGELAKIIGRQNLSGEEVDFDIFCFENAFYTVVGEVVDIEDICEDYRHMKDRYGHQPVNIEIKEVLKGGPLPRNISVIFEFDDRHSKIKEEVKKGKKILLFLNPSLAYYYIPILYGSVYFLEDNMELYRKQLKDIYTFLRRDLPEPLLRKYGFFDYKNCEIICEISEGHSPYYMRKITIFNGNFAKCEIGYYGKDGLTVVEFKLSREFVQELISDFARMDFFNIKDAGKQKDIIKDAPVEKIAFSCNGKRNIIEGFFETYTGDLTEYQCNALVYKLNKVLDYAEENKDISLEKIPEYKGISSTISFEYIKEQTEADNFDINIGNVISCKEKEKLIPYIISRLDFKYGPFWSRVQGEERVNSARVLRYFTGYKSGYNDR